MKIALSKSQFKALDFLKKNYQNVYFYVHLSLSKELTELVDLKSEFSTTKTIIKEG